MDILVDEILTFLIVCITKSQDGSLVHQVFKKRTYMDQYMHVKTLHHIPQKLVVVNTLSIKALGIYEHYHLQHEKNNVISVFKNSVYGKYQGIKTFPNESKGHNNNECLIIEIPKALFLT